MRDGRDAHIARRAFIGLWLALLLLKLALAAHLPLFVDEAFYWQEGRHLDWAYSDLPGLTAWLARLGDALAPGSLLALRLPFLLLAALIPWLLVRLGAREFDARTGWWAGALCLLLPLSGTLGLMALPDVPLLLASVLCLDAGLRMLRKVDAWAAGELALGLALGGLAHYRFAAMIVIGFAALLALRDGRRVLCGPLPWLAIAMGALAWVPLLLWNLHNADAGLRFQLLDRHPWSFSVQGFRLELLQLLPATPLLLLAMVLAARAGLRDARPASRYLALNGALVLAAFLVLGFFADRQRVSFHWPLPGMVALLPLVAMQLAGWMRGWRMATLATTALGLALALGYLTMAALPGLRLQASRGGVYPSNFAGWSALADAVRARRGALPPGTRLLAGDFKIGAELGFALGEPDIPVLAHPLNDKHGRAVQLQRWQLQRDSRAQLGGGAPLLLVASPSHAGFDDPPAYLRRLQQQLGPLPPPQVLEIDGGRKRFWLFVLDAPITAG